MAHNARTRRLAAVLATVAAFALGGCINHVALDDLSDTPPPGTPFQQALYQNYAFLAHSFGEVGQAGYMPFDLGGSTWLNSTGEDVAKLAEAFAEKAVALEHGNDVDPEPGTDNNSHNLRDRLVRALAPGRDAYPRDAARAQADYDCWMLNATVESQAQSAAQCRRSLDITLTRLETEVHAQPPAPIEQTPAPQAQAAPAPSEAAPIPAAVQQASYTVYFDFDSWTLSGEAMSVLQRAVADARAGSEPKILIVGHTDTAGGTEYNMSLSLKRADVVRDALVDMGARREAIDVSGVGKSDLAVPTADGVREPKNRRSVITLAI